MVSKTQFFAVIQVLQKMRIHWWLKFKPVSLLRKCLINWGLQANALCVKPPFAGSSSHTDTCVPCVQRLKPVIDALDAYSDCSIGDNDSYSSGRMPRPVIDALDGYSERSMDDNDSYSSGEMSM